VKLGQLGAMPRSWAWRIRASQSARPGLRSGLAAGVAASALFGVVAIVPAALGSWSTRDVALVGLAVFAIVTSTTTVVASRLYLARLEIRAARLDALAVSGLAQLGGGYPLPFGVGYPMDPLALGELARSVAELRPDLIVELGSGLSSLILGLTVKRLGRGRVVTFDHDPVWAEATRRQVVTLGLTDAVEVIVAPIAEIEVQGARRHWYDLAGRLPEQPIDFLVVDGPAATIDTDGLHRSPAFPILRAHLSEKAVIFVDDYDRVGERRMVERWLADDRGWRARPVATQHGGVWLERVPAV
jgi:predicted O-methyltransferase YrrM